MIYDDGDDDCDDDCDDNGWYLIMILLRMMMRLYETDKYNIINDRKTKPNMWMHKYWLCYYLKSTLSDSPLPKTTSLHWWSKMI